jgi:hypothetical protein
MHEEKQEWFIAERTRALALVALTRRGDLAVRSAAPDTGLQLTVSITKDNAPAVRQFGVRLIGTLRPEDDADRDQAIRAAAKALLRAGAFPYPVVLFHFTMEGDRGHYAWVAEPVVEDGAPRLLTHESPRVHELGRATLDDIVARVDGWYDAFFSRIAAKSA